MADPNKPDFSKTVLGIAERTQQAIGHTRLGSKVVKAFTGSTSPNYVQLDWRSKGIDAHVPKTVKVPGNLEAGRLARNWPTAAILAINEEELKELAQLDPNEYQQAVAYVSEGIVHVGTRPNAESGYAEKLFARYSDEELAVAMRVGRGTLEAAAGIWIPKERAFEAVHGIRVATEAMQIDNHLDVAYPNVALV